MAVSGTTSGVLIGDICEELSSQDMSVLDDHDGNDTTSSSGLYRIEMVHELGQFQATASDS
eukprot:5878322-Karenia_brevis.AAC.1